MLINNKNFEQELKNRSNNEEVIYMNSTNKYCEQTHFYYTILVENDMYFADDFDSLVTYNTTLNVVKEHMLNKNSIVIECEMDGCGEYDLLCYKIVDDYKKELLVKGDTYSLYTFYKKLRKILNDINNYK